MREEPEAIASKKSNMAIMENFQSYKDYISQFILRQGGCATRQIQPYRAIDLASPDLTFGLSWQTALNANQSSCDSETVCPSEAEMNRNSTCIQVQLKIPVKYHYRIKQISPPLKTV